MAAIGLTDPRPASVRAYLAFALVPPALAVFVLWGAPVDGLTADRPALAARDFTVFWTAGRIAASSAWHALADPAALTGVLRELFGRGMPAQIWPYPPTTLLLAIPFSNLPFTIGFLVYTVAALAALLLALRLGQFSWPASLAVLLSPAVADNALAGQNGAITASLLIGGLLSLPRYPRWAGVLLGALVLKPQMAVLLPICLAAGGRWSTLLCAAASALALVSLSAALFGLEPWLDYLLHTPAIAAAYIGAPWHAGSEQIIFASAFMAARSLGANISVAYAVQTAVLVTCAACAIRLWRTPEVDASRRVAATVALSLLACPWVHTYDMPALAACIVILWRSSAPTTRPMLAWAWLWPGLLTLVPVPNILSFLTVGSVAWMASRRPDAHT